MDHLTTLTSDGIVVVNAKEFLADPSSLTIDLEPPIKASGYKPFFLMDIIDHPIAHDENLIGLIEDYYGRRPTLRETRLVLTRETPGPATKSQLWHRDPGKGKRILVFLYLNDVTLENSPFCYVPGTHPTGYRGNLEPKKIESIEERHIRVTDAEMRTIVPEEEWVICTGPRHTMVIADTLGYHKGLKPTKGSRLALNFVYQDVTWA